MKLWLPGDCVADELEAGQRARREVPEGFRPREVPGAVVLMRFLWPLPAGELAVRPELPLVPSIPLLAMQWCIALEGVLWESVGLVSSLQARREWSRAAGVEVIFG